MKFPFHFNWPALSAAFPVLAVAGPLCWWLGTVLFRPGKRRELP